ncbi:MAG: ATP-dependent DNA helicase RecG [Desulfuromonadales bacterium]|nr:ATP-dependent DNA helicase RecG [Desulfuromonadales bacterium]
MNPATASTESRHLLATPVSQLHGVGPRMVEKLARLGIRTVEDALYTLPSRYEDRRTFKKIASLNENGPEVFCARILASGEVVTARSRRRIYEVVVADSSGQLSLKWFHYRKNWMAQRFVPGRRAVFIGELKRFGAQREVHHPDVEFLSENQSLEQFKQADPLNFGRILPVYPLTEGLSQLAARRFWKQVVDRFAEHVDDWLPPALRRQHRLLPLAEALRAAHWPDEHADLAQLHHGCDPARRSLVFEELFFLQLGLALRQQGVAMEAGLRFAVQHIYTKPLAQMLPFRLTAAQRRVLGEIKQDLTSGQPMNRLVQGDVGCGKTLVALMTALVAIENGTQVAVIAPTEILAEQHYLQFHHWLERLGLRAALLRSKMTAADKRQVLDGVASGAVQLVVGTHAVLQEGVTFARLGLGIIDEQHRFGVRQRAVLRDKGESPHMLVMTATPIPRTLSLTVYGDLSLSVIDELPPGRSPVRTLVVPEGRRQIVDQLLREEIEQGRQVYVVYPLIEESEKLDLQAATEGAAQLSAQIFPDREVGLLHGRMSPVEKEALMARFHQREIDILVSTTVIEVGIDVPNATVMVIEHAERFGLAQLHQLRGRVGRGEHGGTCLLVKSNKCSADGEKRLEVMVSTSDGFRIAEADLEIRGPGEFLGTRQSGLPDFRVANILRDAQILEQARQAAFSYLEQVPDFQNSPDTVGMRAELTRRWGTRLELARVG